jgi:ABC-type transport system involved in cytochrome bd biosynthesis fused ATPase/permease subunit
MDNSETNAERIAEAVKAASGLIAFTMAVSGLCILSAALLIAVAITSASGALPNTVAVIIIFFVMLFAVYASYARTWTLSEKFLSRNK